MAKLNYYTPPKPDTVSKKLGLSPEAIARIQEGERLNAAAPMMQVPGAAAGLLPVNSIPAVAAPVATPAVEESGGIGGAISRALQGFSKGASSFRVDPTYNPVLAGLIGGVNAVGAGEADFAKERAAELAAKQKPFQDAAAAGLKKAAEDKAAIEGNRLTNQGILDREKAVADYRMVSDQKKQALLSGSIANVGEAVRRGDLLLSDLPGFGQNSLKAQAIEYLYKNPEPVAAVTGENGTVPSAPAQPHFNPTKGLVDRKSAIKKAEATAGVQGKEGYKMDAVAGSLDDTLRQMEPLVAKLSPTALKAFNDAYQKTIASGVASIIPIGTPGMTDQEIQDANALLGLGNSARGLYSQVIAGGAGTLESDKKANETIGRGLNVPGFRGMQAAVSSEGYSRAGRLTGRINTPLEKPKGYIDQSAPAAPDHNIGTIQDGYRYKGGGWNNPASWEPVK